MIMTMNSSATDNSANLFWMKSKQDLTDAAENEAIGDQDNKLAAEEESEEDIEEVEDDEAADSNR